MNNMLYQQREVAQAVKVDPAPSNFRHVLRILLIISSAFFVGFILLIFSFPTISGINTKPEFINIYRIAVYICIYCFLLLLQIFINQSLSFRRQSPLRKHHEQSRQTAAHGEYYRFAIKQPPPNAYTLPLPFTIGQRVNWYKLLPYLIMMFIITGICILLLAFHLLYTFNSMGMELVAADILITGIIGFECWKFYSHRGVQIIVADDGLFVPISRSKFAHIAWRDARLFAINHVFSSSQYPGCLQFELSSVDTIIRWTWLRPDIHRTRQSTKPVVPRAEYDWQMEALLSHIAARTHLPLYDLRMQQP